MSADTVTIVVPTYKRPEKLRRAIQSISDQTYRDIQILVCDNASSDGTEELVRELMRNDPRINYYCHSENIGFISNFNFGFSLVETSFFGLLTDDDYFLPDFLENAMRAFQEYPQIQMAVSSALVVMEDGTYLADPLQRWPREGLYAPAESIGIALDGSHPIITMCVFRREILAEFCFDPIANSVCDLPVLISVLAKYPFHLSKKPGGYFIRHTEASGNTFVRIANVRAICPAYLRVEELLANNASIDSATRSLIASRMKRNIDRLFFSLMLENLTVSNVECSVYMRDAIRRRPLSAWQLGGLALSVLSRHVDPVTLARSLVFTRERLRKLRSRLGSR